ncbi:BTAD domain-containing putative transcriptional regulator [Streptomyces sp. NPDC058701]|uniref:AfsR/SARP family transcriptional regulator n=1 Tax=Streptomyces sp. NPDC058701 TaxID=3346608 RepID=UPI00365DFD9B
MTQEQGVGDAAGLRFRMLGPMTARVPGGAPLPLGSNQQRALLAVLLLRRGRAAPMAELQDALWGERVPPRAVGTLRTYVSRLRSLFEPDRPARAPARLLLSAPDGYALRLRHPVLDMDQFERGLADAARLRTAGDTRAAYRTLGDALGLWAGTPFAGLPGPYAEGQRDRLTELWLTAREDHFHSALELGLDRDIAAVAALRAFAAEHPLRERTQALLMLALHRAGRSGEALAVYEVTRKILDLELGVPPGPELAALHRRLRSTAAAGGPGAPRPGTDPRPAAAPARGRATPSVTPRAAPAPAPGSTPAGPPAPYAPAEPSAPLAPLAPLAPAVPFAGRAAETGLLARLLTGGADAGADAVPVAVLTGMPGIGKTTLAEHVAEQVRGSFPDGVLRACPRGGAAEALARLVRALGVPGREVPDGLEARAALYRSLLAGRRVLTLLDDAHDTAGLLPLLPGTPGCAALVTSTGRGLLVPGALLVDVGELDGAAALRVLAAAAGPVRPAGEHAALRALADRCSGLPLALYLAGRRLSLDPALPAAALASADGPRLLAALRADGLAVEDRLRRCRSRLTPAAARAFRATAAAPDAFGHAWAADVTGASEAGTADALDELVDSGLLQPGASGSYRYHPLVREFARQAPAPSAR